MKRKTILQALVFLCMIVLLAPAAFGSLVGINFDTGELYDVSTTDASLSVIGNTGVQFIGGMDYGGTLYGVSYGDAALYTIDPTTAAATKVGDLGAGFLVEGGMAMDSVGNLWVVASATGGANMYTVNLATGAATLQGSLSTFIEVNGLALRSDNVMVGVGYDDFISEGGPASLFSINLSTFATTSIATFGFGIGGVSGLAEGYLATGAISGTNALYELNMYTGATTLVGSFDSTITSGNGIGGLAQVPEPATMLLLGFGFIGIGIARRRLK